ncbi:Uncharacterised protein [Sphingobacterium thalpophilum]|uniref:DUF4623 domain-containing protein n=1 Tax=Sphingobacterium thalpophilum TaxID=259 RepID=A0A4U9UUN3_9SPHI|nr:Uncharacterised protein [Sphingobacterium thalpophilum]
MVLGLICAFLLTSFFSCKDELPEAADSSSKFVVLKSIKIVNAGESGSDVVQGTVNEDTKEVNFPRLSVQTDFQNLRFEAEMSDGAKLDKDAYSVVFGEGDTEKTIIIKVQNPPRYREYMVRLRLNVPVFGADFSKAKKYDNTTNDLGNPLYPVFKSGVTRGTGFDGKHVLIVTRDAMGSHLLKVSDIEKGDVTKPIILNMAGVTGGTFTVNMGGLAHGHVYIANLSGGQTSPLKIYHWSDPAGTPQVFEFNIAAIPGAGVRHGDNFSLNLDEKGDGYMFFADNAATKVLRLKVANFNTVTDPHVFNIPITGAGSWTSYNRIQNSNEYIFTGHDAPVALVSDGGALTYAMGRLAIPVRSSDARVIYFNGERYLIVTTAARSGSEPTNFAVYNISKGTSVADALRNLNDLAPAPIFEYSLMGPVNTSPASQTGYFVKKDADGKDESLLLFSAASDAGFVVFEVPKKQLD